MLLLDQTASFLDFALRLKKAGHYPRLCIARDKDTKQRQKTGDGLVEKVENEEWQRHMNWADLVLTSDNVKWLKELDVFKKKGYPVFAPSYESAELELDRAKGQALFKKVGIRVGEFEVFSNYQKAEKHVLAEMKRFVSKPMGDMDKALSYVSTGPDDMVFKLRDWEKKNKLKGSFLLQEFVPGVEFAVAGWLGKKGFSAFFEENFEHKKLMNDNIGPNTGEQGTACKYVENSALAQEVLLPLERELIRMGHTGSVDVSVIVDESGSPMPLEFTSRPGWPAFNIVQNLHNDECQWMVDLLDGEDTFKPSSDVAIGVVRTIPPFPYDELIKQKQKELEGIPIYGLDDENPYRDYIAPCDVMLGEAPVQVDGKVVDTKMMVSCGCYLAVVTGCGSTVREAQKEAYTALDTIRTPNDKIYRTDIGDRLKKELPVLQEYGFATDWDW